MGEARYYMTVKFSSEAKAKKELDPIRWFLGKVSLTEDVWQSNRPNDIEQAKKVDAALRVLFEEVFTALEIKESPDEDHLHGLNYLAGKIDSPFDAEDFELLQEGPFVKFSGTVWHFANWDGLSTAMKNKFGAIDAEWLSDEYVQDEEGFYPIISERT